MVFSNPWKNINTFHLSSRINALARWKKMKEEKKSQHFQQGGYVRFPNGPARLPRIHGVIYEDHNDPSMPDVIPCPARHFVLCTSHYIFGYFGPPQYPTMVIIFRFSRLVRWQTHTCTSSQLNLITTPPAQKKIPLSFPILWVFPFFFPEKFNAGRGMKIGNTEFLMRITYPHLPWNSVFRRKN